MTLQEWFDSKERDYGLGVAVGKTLQKPNVATGIVS